MKIVIGKLVKSRFTNTVVKITGEGKSASRFTGVVVEGSNTYKLGYYSNSWILDNFMDISEQGLSEKVKTQTAIQMVTMNVLEKENLSADDLIKYIKTLAFENKVRSYMRMLDVME